VTAFPERKEIGEIGVTSYLVEKGVTPIFRSLSFLPSNIESMVRDFPVRVSAQSGGENWHVGINGLVVGGRLLKLIEGNGPI
jgi:hypothetical protein